MSLEICIYVFMAANCSLGGLAVILSHVRAMRRDKNDYDLALRVLRKGGVGDNPAEFLTAYADIAAARSPVRSRSSAAANPSSDPSDD